MVYNNWFKRDIHIRLNKTSDNKEQILLSPKENILKSDQARQLFSFMAKLL